MNEEIIILDFSSQSVFIETLTDEKRKEIADENEIDAEELYCEWEIILEALGYDSNNCQCMFSGEGEKLEITDNRLKDG